MRGASRGACSGHEPQRSGQLRGPAAGGRREPGPADSWQPGGRRGGQEGRSWREPDGKNDACAGILSCKRKTKRATPLVPERSPRWREGHNDSLPVVQGRPGDWLPWSRRVDHEANQTQRTYHAWAPNALERANLAVQKDSDMQALAPTDCPGSSPCQKRSVSCKNYVHAHLASAFTLIKAPTFFSSIRVFGTSKEVLYRGRQLGLHALQRGVNSCSFVCGLEARDGFTSAVDNAVYGTGRVQWIGRPPVLPFLPPPPAAISKRSVRSYVDQQASGVTPQSTLQVTVSGVAQWRPCSRRGFLV
jgi:hypothetical protein